MAQEIRQANLFGRIGTGIGKGLAEQIPKEIERNRLASGLQALEKDSGNLSPMQNLTRLASIPGALDHPQLVQSYGELAKQQARGQALIQGKNGQPGQKPPSPFPQREQQPATQGQKVSPSITKELPLQQIQKGYIPKTQDQIFDEAGAKFNENPALFNNDPQKAIEYIEKEDARNLAINEAYDQQHKKLTALQDNVVNRLKERSDQLGAGIVPDNIYNEIKNKAIDATRPKSEGGRGLTEQQAINDYGKELDGIARDYTAIKTIGKVGMFSRPSRENLQNIRSIQEKFEERNDTENLGDKLIADLNLSPIMAYSLAEPVRRDSSLNRVIKDLPKLAGVDTLFETKTPPAISREKTEKVVKKIADSLGKKGSPLAVAYELEKKGYDANVWIDYLIENRKSLGLTEAQGRQIDKTRNLVGTPQDWWLSSFTGLD